MTRTMLLETLDRRFWLAAAMGTALAALALGVPTAVLPNPFFIRMTPTQPLDVAVWLSSSALLGLILATFVARPSHASADPHSAAGSGPTSLAGIGAYLAIGCPICNKIVVGLLGVSGAMGVFGPIQPLIGAASVALLAATLVYRLRQRANGCARCATTAQSSG